MELATLTMPTCEERMAVKSLTMYVQISGAIFRTAINLTTQTGQVLGSRKRVLGSLAGGADDQGSICSQGDSVGER